MVRQGIVSIDILRRHIVAVRIGVGSSESAGTGSRRSFGARAILIILALLGLVGGAAANTAAQSGPQLAALDGILSIQWGNPAPGAGKAPQTIYTLTDSQGQHYQLAIDLNRIHAPMGVLSYNRKHVSIRGVLASRAGGSATIAVDSLVAVDAEERAPAISGSQPFISLMCKFADIAAEPRNLAFFTSQLANAKPGFDHYIREMSYGGVDLAGSTASGWYTLPQARAFYLPDGQQANLDQLAADCTAQASGVDFSPFYGINLMFNGELDGSAWGGSTVLTLSGTEKAWPMTWMPYYGEDATFGWRQHGILAHEIAHAFGSPHSANSTDYQYGSSWDVVSNPEAHCENAGVVDTNYGCVGQHVIAHNKDVMGIIPNGRKFTYSGTAPRTITLERLAQPAGAAGTHLMASIPIGSSGQDFYTVEARFRTGYDDQLPGDGVIMHSVNTQRENQAWILSPPNAAPDSLRQGPTPGVGDLNAIWPAGSTFTDAARNIVIRVDSFSTADGTATITINPDALSLPPQAYIPLIFSGQAPAR
jgi:M6 family metalloprotease-like protein